MSSSNNTSNTDAIMADNDEDLHLTHSTDFNLHAQPPTTSPSASSSTSANKSSSSSTQLQSNIENATTNSNTGSNINTNDALVEHTTPLNQSILSSLISNVNASAVSPTEPTTSISRSSLFSSSPLLVVENAVSTANLSNDFDQPRRSSFVSRNPRSSGTDGLDDFVFAEESQYDESIDEEDQGFGYHHRANHDDHEHDSDELHTDSEEQHTDSGHGGGEGDDYEDDYDGSEEGAEETYENTHHHMLQSIRNVLGMPDFFSGVSDRISPALTAMSHLDDPSEVMTGLQELSEILLMTNEDVLNDCLSTEKVLSALVDIMTSPLYEDNVEICISACRCLSNLLDAVPSSLNRVSFSQIVKALCEKLFEIQYIDIAELALTSLKKISSRQTTAILENGGLTACLSYLDFFSLPTQRIATETVANTLHIIPRAYFDSAKAATPLLEGIINNHDPEIMVNVSKCICGMIGSFSYSTEKVEELVSPKLLKQLFSYIDPNVVNNIPIKPYIITAIASIVKSSTKITSIALDDHLTEKIYEILTKHSVSFDDDDESEIPIKDKNTIAIVQSLIYVDKDILSSSLTVLENLFPSVYVIEGDIGSPYKCDIYTESDTKGSKERTQALLDNKNIVSISKRVISLLIDVYSCTVSLKVRRSVLQTMIEIVSLLTPETLRLVVNDLGLSLLLSSILTQDDQLSLVYGALDISEILLKKLPNIYLVSFFRGGIIDEIRLMSKNETYAAAKKKLMDQIKRSENKELDKSSYNGLGHEDGKHNDEDEADEEGAEEEEEEEEEDYNSRGMYGFDLLGDDDDEREQESNHGNPNQEEKVPNEDDDYGEDEDDEEDETSDSEKEEHQMYISSSLRSRYPSYVNFYSDLRPYIYDKSIEIVKVYESELKSRNVEEEMKKEMNILNLIGQKLQSREDLIANFEKLAGIIDHVSEFELRCSKILSSLLEVLTTGTEEEVSSVKEKFLNAFIKNGDKKALEILIERLNGALNRFEHFEVVSSQSEGISSSFLPSIDRQIRIILAPKVDTIDTKKKKHKSLMISIQAIATFKAIDEFYKTKVRTENGIFSSGSKIFSQLLEETVSNQETPPRNNSNIQSRDESVEPESSDVDIEMPDAPSFEMEEDDSIISNVTDGELPPEASSNEDSNLDTPTLNTERNAETLGAEDEMESSTVAEPSESSSTPYHLEFYIEDKLIPHETPVFGAIYRHLMEQEKQKALEKAQAENLPIPKSFSPRLAIDSIWTTHHKIYFKKVSGERPPDKRLLISESPINPEFNVPESFATSEPVATVVKLLQFLFDLNSNLGEYSIGGMSVGPISTTKFINSKLTAKLNKQLEEPLIVVGNALPAWVIDGCRSYPFLFPFESRHQFLQSTSFGHLRLLHKLQQEGESNGRNSRTQARLVRQKIRIKRAHMLQSAIKVMNHYGSSPCVIEIEFFEDVGTGLGPTLEFYATVSNLFTRKKVGMWRDDGRDASSSFAFSSGGLFPIPYSKEYLHTAAGKKVISMFRALGIFVARALLDSRILDLNFNPMFFKLLKKVKNDEKGGWKTNLEGVKKVDKQLYSSLRFLERFVEAKKAIEKDVPKDKVRAALEDIRVEGSDIASLALDFTYPGEEKLKLVENGEAIEVDINNVEEYIERVVEMTIGEGVRQQLEEFYEGFSAVYSFGAMKSFLAEELVMMCGQGEADWSYETLMANTQANHGYTQDSRVVQDLYYVMSELGLEERRKFLQFVTGSPNLPIGGFKALKPAFTVVCREPDVPFSPDECLPTVMTCVNYFKLPNYSSREILKERIIKAIEEGSGSFMLS